MEIETKVEVFCPDLSLLEGLSLGEGGLSFSKNL